MTIHTFFAPVVRDTVASNYAKFGVAPLHFNTTNLAWSREVILIYVEAHDLRSGFDVHKDHDTAASCSTPPFTAACSSPLASNAVQPGAGLGLGLVLHLFPPMRCRISSGAIKLRGRFY